MHFRAMGKGPAWTRLIAQRRLARFGIFGEGRLLGRATSADERWQTALPPLVLGASLVLFSARYYRPLQDA